MVTTLGIMGAHAGHGGCRSTASGPMRLHQAQASARAPRLAERRCQSVCPLALERSVRRIKRCSAVAEASETVVPQVVPAKQRKYVMVSGKGGVGKTSLSAALAVKYASEGHDTLIVSTDPAHSLGDSLGQKLPGGAPVAIEGTDLPIWGMEIDPDQVTESFKAFAATGGKEKVKVRRRLRNPQRQARGDAVPRDCRCD